MRAEALKGHLEGLLLAVLREEPLHGYAVLEVLRERSGGQIDLPSGTVYPALHRLEAMGLVASGWSQVGGRRRRVYQLTDDGVRTLEEHRRSWQTMAKAVSTVMNVGPAATRSRTV
ncbi:PadR family transcriptional regulator [Pseudosporangium ferrugineum]|nr:helix-turn-helix transcriptional regulator [Pseudosporangium ferrugineum]